MVVTSMFAQQYGRVSGCWQLCGSYNQLRVWEDDVLWKDGQNSGTFNG
jgi:hypothetical protein